MNTGRLLDYSQVQQFKNQYVYNAPPAQPNIILGPDTSTPAGQAEARFQELRAKQSLSPVETAEYLGTGLFAMGIGAASGALKTAAETTRGVFQRTIVKDVGEGVVNLPSTVAAVATSGSPTTMGEFVGSMYVGKKAFDIMPVKTPAKMTLPKSAAPVMQESLIFGGFKDIQLAETYTGKAAKGVKLGINIESVILSEPVRTEIVVKPSDIAKMTQEMKRTTPKEFFGEIESGTAGKAFTTEKTVEMNKPPKKALEALRTVEKYNPVERKVEITALGKEFRADVRKGLSAEEIPEAVGFEVQTGTVKGEKMFEGGKTQFMERVVQYNPVKLESKDFLAPITKKLPASKRTPLIFERLEESSSKIANLPEPSAGIGASEVFKPQSFKELPKPKEIVIKKLSVRKPNIVQQAPKPGKLYGIFPTTNRFGKFPESRGGWGTMEYSGQLDKGFLSQRKDIESKLSQAASPKNIQKTTTRQGSPQIPQTSLKNMQGMIQPEEIKISEITRISDIQRTRQIPKEILQTRMKMPSIEMPKIPIETRLKLPTPFRPSKPKSKPGDSIFKQGMKKGFIPFIKRRGRFLPVGRQAMTFEAALGAGAQEAEHTAAATFKLVPVSASSVISGGPRFNPGHFYQKKGAFIEKTIHRINTPGELQQITKKGIAASRLRGFR